MSFYGVLVDNEDSNVEIVNEVRVTSTKNFAITVDGDGLTNRGFEHDPYFKVYNSTNSAERKELDNTLSNNNVWRDLITHTNEVISGTGVQLDTNLIKPDYTKLED